MLTRNYLPTPALAHRYGISMTPDTRQVQSLVQSAFSTLTDTLVGKVIISKGIDSTIISLPYHMVQGALSHSMVNALGLQLAQTLGCPVELRLIRLSAPYLDASILAQWLTQDLGQSTFRQTMGTLMSVVGPSVGAPSVPGAITGIKVQLAGRLITEPSQPRTVVQSATLGSFRPSPNQALQAASHMMVNRKGTFTVKVWLSVQA
jgi:ribosomal protein S3